MSRDIPYSRDFPTQNPYQGTFASLYGEDAFIVKLFRIGKRPRLFHLSGGIRWGYWNWNSRGRLRKRLCHGNDPFRRFSYAKPVSGAKAGPADAFIVKLSATGSGLVYSTFLGGSRDDYVSGIAVDTSGNAYVTGYTTSSNFPTKNPYQGICAGGYDAFVAKFSGETTFQWPVDNPTITQSYACEGCYVPGKYHTGLDFISSTGSTTIYASDSGTVIRIDKDTYPHENRCMGNVVIIDHNNGFYSLYAHMASIEDSVTDGQNVTKGDPIGIMGNTGSK